MNADVMAENIIDTIHEPLIVLDSDFRVILASLSFYQIFKVNPEDTVGQFIYDLGNGQWDIPKLHELLENILPKKTAFNKFEVEHNFISLGKRTMLLNARQIVTSSKELRILLAMEDITDRKLAEQKALDALELAESIFDTIHESLIVLDADLRVISASLSFYKTFKVNAKETVGQLIYDLGNRQWNIPALRELLDNILSGKTSFNKFEVVHDFTDIGKRTMLLNARQILGTSEKSRIILLAMEDITDRKLAEQKALDALELAESIIDTIHEPLIVLDADLRAISASLSFYKTFKVNSKETVGQLIYDLGNRQWNIPALRDLLDNILSGKTSFNKFEVVHDFTDIGKRTMLLNARQILGTSEKSRIILLAIEDITEQMQVQFFKESHEFTEGIIDNVREPLIVLDNDLRVVFANRSFYQVFKTTPQETEKRFIYELGTRQWDIPELRALLEDIVNKSTTFENCEVKIDLQAIGPKTMLLNARKIVPENAEKKLLLLSLEDVSKRKEAEEETKRAFKAKSTFTSLVSHELRTPLTSLKQSVSLLVAEKLGGLNPEQKKFLDIAERNLDRLIALINNVLDFQKLESGKMIFKMEENDINSAVIDSKDLMSTLVAMKGIEFIIDLDENLPKGEFDKGKIIQVITNLVNNALNATEKGYIKITTNRNNDLVQVSVEDTGHGIKKEDLSKLFQEYEQINRVKGGTGLGLVISEDIISAHSGKIWAESVFGMGTTISFVLPFKTPKNKRLIS